MPNQASKKPHRKVWVGATGALLTLAVHVIAGFDLPAEQITTISTGVGALLAYLVPASEKDFQRADG